MMDIVTMRTQITFLQMKDLFSQEISLQKLTKRAKKLGAESLDYSTRKNNKYMATLPGGKKVHFGCPKYADYTIHKDKERRDKYLARATKIKNKQGELTYTNPESSNYWSVNLLWPKKN